MKMWRNEETGVKGKGKEEKCERLMLKREKLKEEKREKKSYIQVEKMRWQGRKGGTTYSKMLRGRDGERNKLNEGRKMEGR